MLRKLAHETNGKLNSEVIVTVSQIKIDFIPGKSIKENLRPVLEWLKDFWDGFVEFFEEKILWCIELWDKLANKVRGIRDWFTGNDTASNVGSMQGNTSRVISDTINNSTSNYDFRGSSIITRATNGQDFQSLIGSEIQNSIGGIS